MSYIQEENNALSREGLIGTIIVHWILFLIFWFMVMSAVPKQKMGVIINFGTVETGSGEESPQSSEESTPPPAEQQAAEETPEEVVEDVQPAAQSPTPTVEQDVHKVKDENSVAVPTEKPDKKDDTKDEEKKKKDKTPPKTEEKIEDKKEEPAEKVEEKLPEIDQRSLFKKKNTNSSNSSTSQGNSDNPKGDMGHDTDEKNRNQNSDIYAPSRDIGMSDSGNFNFELAGRNLVRKPDISTNYDKEGRVAIRIKVNSKGEVIDASYTSKGSSTSDAKLKSIAIQAAKDSKFNFDPNAPDIQSGTITFTFKIR